MAGHGPPPKDARTRQRRNRTTTAATLPAEAPRKRTPELSKARKWNSLTRQWWKNLWASPMAREFLQSDEDQLLIVAVLLDRFWVADDSNDTKAQIPLAQELRLQCSRFGLSPIDRRRLQWEIQREDSERRGISQARPRSDPRRAALKAVK